MNGLRFESPATAVVVAVLLVALCAVWADSAWRQRRRALTFWDDELVRTVAGRQLTRRVPVILVVAGLVAVSGAAGDPQTQGAGTSDAARVVLLIDTSGSMNATDVAPSRIEAARTAGRAFIDAVPAGTEIAVVAFSTGAIVVQTPTISKDTAKAALDRLVADGGTAIGEGLYTALSMLETNGWTGGGSGAVQHRVGTIILLADGESNSGRKPDNAVRQATASGATVHTIAFGTSAGNVDGMAVGVDPAFLMAVAGRTGGTFYEAATADELISAFGDLVVGTRDVFIWRSVANLWATVGGALIAVGVTVALRRRGRII